jgi:Flp pilus assembly protein TadG
VLTVTDPSVLAAGPGGRGRGDAGSSLLLFPAAVLIVLVLGAVAVDLSAVHLAKRQVLDLAASAANDAVTAGLDQGRFRATGEYVIDAALATRAVERAVAANEPDGRTTVVRVELGPDPGQVTVELRAPAEPVFSSALPGGPGTTTVSGTATATALGA